MSRGGFESHLAAPGAAKTGATAAVTGDQESQPVAGGQGDEPLSSPRPEVSATTPHPQLPNS
jgi:hypothetical protein